MWSGTEPSAAPPTYQAEFVSKLYRMLDNPDYRGIVSWSVNQDSFLILDISAFQEKIIPNEFSHSNFSSFVRQLNKYDFHKQRFQDPNSRVWEFKHKDFIPANRNRPYIIKRKPAASRSAAAAAAVAASATMQVSTESVEELQGVLAEVQGRIEKLEHENSSIRHMLEKQETVIHLLLERGQILPAHATNPVPVHDPGPPQVCVAMIDENARSICANILREYGCIVDTTGSGVELIRMVDVGNYRLVILEPVLTSLDGLSAATLIRRNNLTIPLIFCVNKEQNNLAVTESYYQSRGISSVLWRPFTKQQLYNALLAYM